MFDLPPDCQRFRLSAPGNLLVCGEYAVTETGGHGIWLAPELRAVLHCRPADRFRFQGLWPGGGLTWTTDAPNAPPALLQAVLDGLAELARDDDLPPVSLGPWELELDTTAFFDPAGRKLGYGSSAASCLLLGAALLQLHLATVSPAQRQRAWAKFPVWSVDNHRRFQGGRGSGYDIFCSLYGGLGRFIGGQVPDGKILSKRTQRLWGNFTLRPGPAAVRTTAAIAAWTTWRDSHPEAARQYLSESAANAAALAKATDATTLGLALAQARATGQRLGQAIGVSADLPSGASKARFAKAVGAGNETILELEPANGPSLTVARQGLVAQLISQEASAKGKLLLFGEHVALYGWPACGTPLETAIRIRFSPSQSAPTSDPTATPASPPWNFPDLAPDAATAAITVLELARATRPDLTMPPGQFWVSGTVPLGSGFGSSAAFCAALARLAVGWSPEQGIAETDETLWALATRLDGHFHGRASGIDTGLALASGPCTFQPATSPGNTSSALDRLPLNIQAHRHELWLVYAAVPRQGHTRQLVAAIRAGLERQAAPVVHAIAELGRISQTAIELLQGSGSAHDLGCLAQHAQDLLGQLGLSSPALEAALTIGRLAGAAGGKLSGAGGGGAFYLWADSQTVAGQIATALDQAATGPEPLPLSARPGIIQLA